MRSLSFPSIQDAEVFDHVDEEGNHAIKCIPWADPVVRVNCLTVPPYDVLATHSSPQDVSGAHVADQRADPLRRRATRGSRNSSLSLLSVALEIFRRRSLADQFYKSQSGGRHD